MKHVFITHFSSWPNRKKWSRRAQGSSCDLFTIPCGVVLTERHEKFHSWILSAIPSRERRIMVCRADPCDAQYRHLLFLIIVPSGLEQWPLCLLAGSFPMHPSTFSWILFLPNRSDCLPSWVFLGHQAKCHTHVKLFELVNIPLCHTPNLYASSLWLICGFKSQHSL